MFLEYSRKTFAAAAAIPAASFVKLGADGVQACVEGDSPIGFSAVGAGAGESVEVRLLNATGTVEARAGGAITIGAELQAGADGSVIVHSGSSRVVGIALGAAANGDYLEVMPCCYAKTTAA